MLQDEVEVDLVFFDRKRNLYLLKNSDTGISG